MARFLRFVLLSTLAFTAALWLLSWVLLRFPVFAHDVLGYPKEWVRVSMRMSSAREHVLTDTLYIGDSVGGQLRPYDGERSLASNGSVMPVGNYLLVEQAIRNRTGLKVVEYMSVPQVLGHKFERPRTCNNFAKPFLTWENAPSLDATVYAQLDRKPLSYLYFLPPAKTLPLADLDFEDGVEKPQDLLSDLSLHWIARLDSLCTTNGVELILRSPPVAEHMRLATNDWQRMREQAAGSPSAHLFDRYFSSIQYLPDSLLRDDVHWRKDFIAAHREELVARMERR